VFPTQGYLSPGELDPLNRRLVAEPKPDIVVQGWCHTAIIVGIIVACYNVLVCGFLCMYFYLLPNGVINK